MVDARPFMYVLFFGKTGILEKKNSHILGHKKKIFYKLK